MLTTASVSAVEERGSHRASVPQIALSLALLVGTIAFMLWLCSRIYRIGALMYGKRPTLPEILKWLKYAKA